MDAFEQLGTLSSFNINLSYNNIQRLIGDTEASEPVHQMSATDEESEEVEAYIPSLASVSSSSIESIDLSHNNISFISPHFFAPISSTLIELDISENRLQVYDYALLEIKLFSIAFLHYSIFNVELHSGAFGNAFYPALETDQKYIGLFRIQYFQRVEIYSGNQLGPQPASRFSPRFI